MSEIIIRKENQVCNYALTGWIVVAEETESVQYERTNLSEDARRERGRKRIKKWENITAREREREKER